MIIKIGDNSNKVFEIKFSKILKNFGKFLYKRRFTKL